MHSRYRSSSGASVVARFNERFILSLASCDDCLILDDELNVLPISRGKDIEPLDDDEITKGKGRQAEIELATLKASFESDKLRGDLVKLAKTVDQVRHYSHREHFLIVELGTSSSYIYRRNKRENSILHGYSDCSSRTRKISCSWFSCRCCCSTRILEYFHHFPKSRKSQNILAVCR